ncbi:MAG: C4-type zinc ribbon domain-containing protein [Chloroflexi bacterium]|nr:C4-type zinc ribbon domain-containing protein [Chloroflexota bacterium]
MQSLIAALEARRSVVAARLRGDDQAVYNTLAIRLSGRPVARVERGICQECRIALPTVVIQRARRGEELANCSSCQRILFVG